MSPCTTAIFRQNDTAATASVSAGTTFRATDTVRNQGAVTATASATRYYLSLDRSRNAGDVLLTGQRSVNNVNAGNSSSGNANVTVPAGTAAGAYYLLACADDLNAVAETDETNNCNASTATTTVK